MGRFFKFMVFLIIMAGIAVLLWTLNFFGFINVKELTLQGLSLIPGMNDLKESYELGQKRGILLKRKEADLKRREAELEKAQQQLAAEQNQLAEAKAQWQNEHPVTAGTSGLTSVAEKERQAKEQAKLKEYLAMVGGMKPKKAAIVIQKLPEETVFSIFEQLQKHQVTKIMENLPEDYLAKLTQDRLIKYRNN